MLCKEQLEDWHIFQPESEKHKHFDIKEKKNYNTLSVVQLVLHSSLESFLYSHSPPHFTFPAKPQSPRDVRAGTLVQQNLKGNTFHNVVDTCYTNPSLSFKK